MLKRVFIIHGWGATSKDNWFPWLKTELEKKGFEVIVPDLPNTMSPKLDKWLSVMNEIANKIDNNTCLIGHSLGCTLIMRFFETLGTNVKIGRTIFVSGPIETRVGELHTFFNKSFNWSKIRKHSEKFIVIQSKNDHLVPSRNAEIIAKNLGAELVMLDNGGHFLTFELPIVLEKLLGIGKGK